MDCHITLIFVPSLHLYLHSIKIEQRNPDEVWNTNLKIKIQNPAFELIKKQNITAIISELGTLSYSNFLKKIK